MVNWCGFPLWKGLFLNGTPRIPNHQAPNHLFTSTPQKFNTDTQHGRILKKITFSKPSQRQYVLTPWHRIPATLAGLESQKNNRSSKSPITSKKCLPNVPNFQPPSFWVCWNVSMLAQNWTKTTIFQQRNSVFFVGGPLGGVVSQRCHLWRKRATLAATVAWLQTKRKETKKGREQMGGV